MSGSGPEDDSRRFPLRKLGGRKSEPPRRAEDGGERLLFGCVGLLASLGAGYSAFFVFAWMTRRIEGGVFVGLLVGGVAFAIGLVLTGLAVGRSGRPR